MKVNVYGEDGITLWYIQNKLKTNNSIKHVYYRTSFGREQHCFGEFDLIYWDKRTIYLCECKWHAAEVKSTWNISIDEVQTRGHKILKKIIEEANSYEIINEDNWDDFYSILYRTDFKNDFRLPKPGKSLLERNIKRLIIDLKHNCTSSYIVKNIVIAFYYSKPLEKEVVLANTFPDKFFFELEKINFGPFVNNPFFVEM